ncbi:PKD domain-containing protein [Fulvivirga sp. 29W222]|uniref:PKD domain-containing protein n=2 Tax=Fulvivirga marina TaxID=2494733 RepID=A0A937KEW2_9BACT|nr:PKD domain-containing protein [Fulvivirga marina]
MLTKPSKAFAPLLEPRNSFRGVFVFTIFCISLLVNSDLVAQCGLSGLSATYCSTDGVVTLFEATSGGTFSGTGIVGNTFDPSIAGPGTHTINYENYNVYSANTSGTFDPFLSLVGWTKVPNGATGDLQNDDDELSVAVNIGFTFRFFGNDYTQLYASSNGNIAFTSYTEGAYSNTSIPAVSDPNNMIAILRTDLDPSNTTTDRIKYRVEGTAPNRVFILYYENVERFGTVTGDIVTTQLKLFETTNAIEIHTTENNATLSNETSLQGIENATGTIGYTISGRNDEFWTATNDFVSFIPCTDSQMVTVYEQPVADAGTGGNVCGKDAGNPFMFTGVGSVGTGTWSQQSGPGVSSFGNANVASTTVTADTYGSYVYRWTETNGGCSSFSEVTVNFYEPTIADAGVATAEECDLNISLAGVQSISGSTASWSVVAGNAADITFSNSNIFNPTATSTAYGTYTFRLTESNGVCTSTDDITVTYSEQPVADAGTGGNVCGKDAGNPFTFTGVGSVGTGTWSQQSGPGVSSFGNANVASTTVTADTYGSYVYRWTETNGGCSSFSEVTVNFYEPTIADAGVTTAEECDLNISLAGVQSISGSTASWSVVAGNAADITFSNSNIFNPTATSTAYGTYTFRLTESNGVCTSTDDITVTYSEQPVANAGLGGSECDLNFTFNATLSTPSGTGLWTKVSGPAGESYNDASLEAATVTVTAYGTYVYRWTETNGGCSSFSEVTVNFYEPTIADAGVATAEECDLNISLAGVQSISGSTASWSVVAGNAADITFSNSNIFNPTATSTAYGTYTFRLTESNGVCTSTDDITVTYSEQPVADAGTGGNVCGKDAGNPFTLTGVGSVGTGTWSQQSGPGISVFADINLPTSSVTVDTYGTYVYRWTEVNGVCSDFAEVTVIYYEPTIANADRGNGSPYDECDQVFLLDAVPSIAGSSGVWSMFSGAGIATFTNSTSPTTQVMVSAYGNYIFRWTETNGACSTFDDVEVNFYLQPVADAGAGGSECDLDFTFNASPSIGIGLWTQVGGPGISSFVNANNPGTSVSVDTYGTYVFRWSENNNGCIDYDDITVSFNQSPTVVSVADDGAFFCEPATVSLSGQIGGGATTGSWSLISGGSGTLSASSLTVNTVTATYILAPDEYGPLVFRLTTDDADGAGPCIADFAETTITINQAAQVFAGIDFEICEDETATINGVIGGAATSATWGGGAGVFGDVNNPITTYKPTVDEINAGFVILTLTTNDPDAGGPCSSESDNVRITINKLPEVALTGLGMVYAENDPPVEMEGFPSGGTYIGPGVNSGTNIFDPSNANIGGGIPNLIVYEYTHPITGCTNADTVEVLVNAATTINFTVDGATIDNNTGNQQICAEQGLVKLFGSPSVSTGLSPTNFSSTISGLITQAGGEYYIQTDGFGLVSDTVRIKYTYTNSDNVTTVIYKDVIIFGSPVADISVTNSCIADVITFTDNTSAPSSTSLISWVWDFGDGTFSNQQNPTHTYDNPGIYTVKLIATTVQGCSDQSSKVVRVGEVPVVDFERSEICNGDATEFRDLSDPGSISTIVTHTWDFGDGEMITGLSNDPIPPGTHGGRTTGTYKNPFHEYVNVGNYKVNLTVETNDGCSNSTTKDVFILPFNVITILPETAYEEDFEVDAGGWVAQSNEGAVGDSSWVWSEPNGSVINSPGNKVWWTGGNSGSYNASEDSFINGPCFDVSGLDRPMIAMDIWVDTQDGFDGAVLQYSVDGGISWQNIGAIGGGINWYNTQGIISRPGDRPGNFNEGDQGWTGQTGGWVSARFSLDEIPVAERSLVRLRIAFASDANNPQGSDLNGFAFDNVFVGNKTRTVLIEHFADSEVDISNQATGHFEQIEMNQITATGVSDFTLLEYHIANSGGDPFNGDNPGDPSARSLYYGVSQAPNAVLGGNQFNGNPFEISVTDIDRRSLEDPLFKISIDTISSAVNTLVADVTIEALTAFTEEVTVHLALVETEVIHDGITYHNVLKKLLFGGNGQSLALSWTPGTTKTLRAEWNVNVPIYNPDKLGYIAFVQNKTNREVYATASSAAPAKESEAITGLVNDLLSQVKNISVYPNPADRVLNFAITEKALETYTWKIVDQRGVTMEEGRIEFDNGLFSTNIENLSNGIYYVVIGTDDKALIYRKLAVMNRK